MIVRTYHTEVRRPRLLSIPAAVCEPNNVSGPWTDEEIATFERLIAAGASLTAIGKKLGRTRSSVAGFDYRRQRR